MTDLVTDETITEIAQEFWGAYLPGEEALEPSGALPVTDDVRGRVDIDGAWKGVVELSCSTAVARRVASAMFCLPDAELAPTDVLDALGELVNVVGGNIKSILPAPCSLSTPKLDDASEWRFGAELESEVLLAWSGEPVVVRVWRLQDRDG
jgi:chemotaxis protein CheX